MTSKDDIPFIETLGTDIPENRYLTTVEVAEAFNKSHDVVRQWLYIGRSSTRPLGRPRFPEPDVQPGMAPLWTIETLRKWSYEAQVPILGETLKPLPEPVKPKPDPEIEKKLARARAKKEKDVAALQEKRAAARAKRYDYIEEPEPSGT